MARKLVIVLVVVIIGVSGYFFGLPKLIENADAALELRTDGKIVLGMPSVPVFDARFGGTHPTNWQAYWAMLALNRAMNAYPESVLKTEALNVLLTGQLTLLDIEIGGSVQPDGWLLLATSYLGPGVPGSVLERIFHHEFSSLLMAQHVFPREAWRAALPKGFTYPSGELAELEAAQRLAKDQVSFHAQGFVSDYGASSLENDVNTYAELLLGGPDELAVLEAQFPMVREKAGILREFYRMVAIKSGGRMRF